MMQIPTSTFRSSFPRRNVRVGSWLCENAEAEAYRVIASFRCSPKPGMNLKIQFRRLVPKGVIASRLKGDEGKACGVNPRCRADNAERLRFNDFVKYRDHVTAKLDYRLPFARNVGCL